MKSGRRVRLPKVEPTPEKVYADRRSFMKKVAYGSIFAATAGVWGYRGIAAPADRDRILAPGLDRADILKLFPLARNAKFDPKDLQLTEAVVAGSHNNFYEFIAGGGGPVWKYVDKFKVDPWTIEVGGECHKPRRFDLDDLFRFEQEERVYRLRCVETWAIVVPWTGFALRKLLEAVAPTDHAKHVRFISANVPEQMPGVVESTRNRAGYSWPYHEALRIDEAMNELTLLVTGIYGKPLPKQHGAPVRVIVPWKYGYKNPKSIVKIELVREQPDTFWSSGLYRHEYGYLSNVNPNVPHPRWSQASEYRLTGDPSAERRDRYPTQLFNGYGDYVARLYPDEPTAPQPPLRPGQVAR